MEGTTTFFPEEVSLMKSLKMRKSNPHFVVCFNRWFVPLMCFVLFFSCQDDLDEEDLRALITDTWYSESVLETTPPLIYRNETTYLEDGTFTRTTKVLDASRNVLGYVSLHEGSYRIDADTLIAFDTDYYGLNNASSYLDLDELQFETNFEIESKTRISFNAYYSSLTLNVICPLYSSALCIDKITMERVRIK
ncbi:hypothetical protein [Catalinimonas niigatensis]|uniref:hypothetical protein n=1 Tax=Catalinimonas niigatensis TaxID=1397264 RepID=UPI00266550A0|nr:hypothetical protein [Catalinimonas niigatensis]WPP49091.1 hypothetical protein PZB72_20700 [Catalinimonas niigatensis]